MKNGSPRRRMCTRGVKEETPGQDDTRVPFGQYHEQERLIIIAYAQPNPAVLQRILPACYPNA